MVKSKGDADGESDINVLVNLEGGRVAELKYDVIFGVVVYKNNSGFYWEKQCPCANIDREGIYVES